MEIIADILLAAGALGAGFYCLVLSRRLKRFNDLEKGVGGAVAVLSSQVDDLNKSLKSAQKMSEGSSKALEQMTGRAESVAQRLELLMASMHDMPEAAPAAPAVPAAPAEAPAAPAAEAPAPAAAPAPQPEEESDALAAAYEAGTPAEAEPQEEPAKPSGLMFVRHNRSRNRVA